MDTRGPGAALAPLALQQLRQHAVVLLDPAGTIVGWNAGATRMLGYAAAEVLGRNFTLLYFPPELAAGKPAHELREAAETGCSSDDNWLRRRDGTAMFASGLTEPLQRDGELLGYAKLIRDVTDRRRIDEAVQEHAPGATVPAAADEAASEPAPVPAEAIRVLVADDNMDGADMVALLLRLKGYTVDVSYEPQAALDLAAKTRPDVLLLDIGLPGMDGYEVARRLRARPEHAGLVIVAMTGYGSATHRARAFEAGCDHHLLKPVDPGAVEALLADVARALARGRAEVSPALP